MPFELPRQSINALRRASWFPGHMYKTLKDYKSTHFPSADIILEVRDSRVPFSSINGRLFEVISETKKDRMIVYNKTDLILPDEVDALKNAFKKWRPSENILFTSCRESSKGTGASMILSELKKFSRERITQYPILRVLVVGMPNVGKSTLLNELRHRGVQKGNAAAVGALPGITRRVSTQVKISDDPPIYILDSPGVMVPFVSNPETVLKLGMTAGTKPNSMDMEIVVDYLLYHLNEHGFQDAYLKYSTLEMPVTDANTFLPSVAVRIGALLAGGIPDIGKATEFILRRYREGKLGNFCLDDLSQTHVDEFFSTNKDMGMGGKMPEDEINVTEMSKNQLRKRLWNEKMKKSEEKRMRRKALTVTL